MALREAFHYQLSEYIQPLDKEEYEKFLGTAGKVIARRLFPSAKQWNWQVQKNKCVNLSTKVG